MRARERQGVYQPPPAPEQPVSTPAGGRVHQLVGGQLGDYPKAERYDER